MKFLFPYIVKSNFVRKGREGTRPEEGYVRYLKNVEVKELTKDEVPIAVAARTVNDEELPVRHFDGNFYVEANMSPIQRQHQTVTAEVLVDRNQWPAYASVLATLFHDAYTCKRKESYSYMTYKDAFDFDSILDAPISNIDGPPVINIASVYEMDASAGEVASKEIEMRRLVEDGSLLIEGKLFRKIAEPRLIARFHDWRDEDCVVVLLSLEDLKHGKMSGLSRQNDYHPPFETASFRLDQMEVLIEYLAIRNSGPRDRRVYFDVSSKFELMLPGTIHFDSEADALLRTAQWIVDNEYVDLKELNRDRVVAWVELRDAAKRVLIDGGEGALHTLERVLVDYAISTDNNASRRAAQDLTVRRTAAERVHSNILSKGM